MVIESGEEALSKDRIYLITLSIHPLGNEYQVSWFVNGVRTASETVFFPQLVFPEDTVSTIGGSTGFRGIIDEFGIYYKDAEGRMSVNPDVYREAMEYRLGGDLLFAEGFDGLFLPETVEYTGDVQSAEGFLLVGPGSSLSIPDFEIANEYVIFQLGLSKFSPETRVVIAAVTSFGEENPVFEYVPGSGSVLLPDGREVIPVNSGEFQGFTLEHNSPELLLVNGDKKISLATGFPDSIILTLSLQNRSEELSCELDTILIQREQNRIVKEQKPDPSPEETDRENV